MSGLQWCFLTLEVCVSWEEDMLALDCLVQFCGPSGFSVELDQQLLRQVKVYELRIWTQEETCADHFTPRQHLLNKKQLTHRLTYARCMIFKTMLKRNNSNPEYVCEMTVWRSTAPVHLQWDSFKMGKIHDNVHKNKVSLLFSSELSQDSLSFQASSAKGTSLLHNNCKHLIIVVHLLYS